LAPAWRSSEAKDVPERVRGDALALVHAGGVDVAAEDLTELRVVEPVALHADEDRLVGHWDARRVVLGEERRQRGVDRDRPLTAALRSAHSQQPTGEVDVVPLEPEQFAPPQSRVRHQREQEPVALRLAGEVALPKLVARGLGE
jgi:hypothetical protein